jgi:cellobiose phosphorylase
MASGGVALHGTGVMNGQQVPNLEAINLKGWGRFNGDCAGFDVQRYFLPREWDYVLGDERLFWRMTHTGHGYLQAVPPGGTYWLRSGAAASTPGWLVWVVVEDEPRDYFTNFWGPRPAGRDPFAEPQAFACRWQADRAQVNVQYRDIQVETELGVASSMPAALMRIRVANRGTRARRVTLVPCMTPWLVGAQSAPWEMSWLYQGTAYDRDANSLTFEMRSPAGNPEQRRALRWMLDTRFDRMCLDAGLFRGRGSDAVPEALFDQERWTGAANAAVFGQPLFAALGVTVELAPDEAWQCGMALADAVQEVHAQAGLMPGFDTEVDAVGERKRRFLETFSVQTPDAAFTRYVNEYLALQQQLVLHRGWPCNMMGTRDTAQDYTAVVSWCPQETRDMILRILETERHDGWFVRQFSTAGREGMHDSRPYVDSGLWVWELVYEYVCRERDFDLLACEVPFLDRDETTSVLDHLERLLGYYMEPGNVGEHGLCKIREGDWNDSVNAAGLQGRGESVMTSCHLVLCLRQAATLFAYLREHGHAGAPDPAPLEQSAVRMRRNIRESALNAAGFLNGVYSDGGQWFFSDRDPDGCERFNTAVNAFGIIGGIFEDGELDRLCERIRDLRRPYGYPLFAPPIGEPPMPGLGRIGSGDLRPGLGENGTCYNHGCHGFLARAMAIAGRGDLFHDVMLCLFPYDPVRHPVQQARTAPYAIVNVYMGAPGREGEGGDTFFSGSIATAVRNVYTGLLGAYAEPGGLRFRPCLPTAWDRVDGRIVCAGRPLAVSVCRTDDGVAVAVDGVRLKDGFWAAPAPTTATSA